MSNESFFEDLIAKFPILSSSIEQEDADMIHMRMEVFSRYTNQVIKENDIDEISKCFNFIESKIDLMDSQLKNALTISYCEALLLGENASEMEEITKIMPQKLLNDYIEYKHYYEGLCSKSSSTEL